MPVYQYQCNDCGEALEIQQSFSDDALTVCPACGGHLRKVFNAVGVVFKGSGFYRTDSRGSGSSSDGAAKSASTSSDSSSTKTDSTPAPKKDASPSKGSAA